LGVTRNPRLTPALRRLLVLIAEGGERGRIKREIDASGSRARLQLRTLMEAGYVEWVVEETDHRHFSECVRISDAGMQELAMLDRGRRAAGSDSRDPSRPRQRL
jgi:hypothetical protein